MSPKRLLALAGLLAALLVMAALLRGRDRFQQTHAQVEMLLAPSDLALDKLTGIELIELSEDSAQPSRIEILRSSTGEWRVVQAYEAPADPERLTRLISALRGMSGEERVRGDCWFNKFGVGAAGVTLTLRQGNRVLVSLVLGRAAKNRTNFSRRPGEETIYALDADPLAEIPLSPAQ